MAATTSSSSSVFGKLQRMVSSKKQPQELVIPQQVLPSTLSLPPRGLEHVFRCFDENGDGRISPSELHSCMKATAVEISLEEAEEAVTATDSDGDGLLSMEDFVQLMGDHEEKDKSLREAFGAYEMEGRGCITPKSLKRALERLGGPTTIRDCREMIKRFDVNGDGVICFDEFSMMMNVQG